MRIAFVGKGGSGKTTTSSLFSRYLASLRLPVLAIDADINQHMGPSLGISYNEMEKIPALGHNMPKIKQYLAGNNPRVRSDVTFRMTTPPGTGSNIIRDWQSDPLINEFSIKHNGINFIATGDFDDEDVGMVCYHGKSMATEILLNHLVDGENDYIVVDMTAGADAFSTGLFFKFDLLALVVEPTLRSLEVFKQYSELGSEYDLNLVVIGNKITCPEDEEFIKNIVGDHYLASLPLSNAVKSADRGNSVLLEDHEDSLKSGLDSILKKLNSTQKNWNKFYEQLINLHRKHAKSWLNDRYGMDFTDQIDPDFNGEKLAG